MRRVWFSPEALIDARGASTWWRDNRPKNPDLFRDELRRALALLQATPLIGSVVGGVAGEAGVRVVRLRGSKYLLYYSVHDDEVEVLRLWHSSRAARPVPP